MRGCARRGLGKLVITSRTPGPALHPAAAYTRPRMTQPVTHTLSCGLPLIVEPIPGVRSLGLTWLIPAGPASDPADQIGRCAILSEMLNRGAGTLDSRAHADALDALGASKGTAVDTFDLALSATLLGGRLERAMPLLADVILRPRLEAADLEPARDLCLQSLESLKDDPQERVMILLKDRHAPPPINRSGLGTEAGLRAVDHDSVRAAWRAAAVPGGGSVLALAGDVDPARAVALLEGLLAGWGGACSPITWGEPTTRGYHHEMDTTNQVHIALAHDAPPETSDDAWLERVVTAVLSGGMSGRLFSEVREKRSLCYSVYAAYSAQARFGRSVAYSGTTPERAQETLNVLMGELVRITTPAGRVTPAEFSRAVVGMKSKLIMAGESTSARAGALARDYRRLGRPRSLEEITKRIDAVTLDEVNAYLARRPLGVMTIATIGPAPLNPPSVR